MIVIILSILSAIAFGFHAIFIKIGLKDSDPLSATLISSAINVGFLWILTLLFVPLDTFVKPGLIYLIIGGLLAPSLARVFLYTGFEKVGVSVTAPIRTTFPIVSSVLAILFLNEPLTVPIGAAIIFTVMGTMLLSMSSSGRRLETQLQWKKRDLLFPFTAAVFYGVSHFIRKIGLATVPSGITAATVVTTVSLVFFLMSLPVIKQKRAMVMSRKSIFYYSLGGIAGSFGQMFILSALRLGRVSIVTPIAGITPIFILIMTYLFFRTTEKINFLVLAGVVSIVLGVVLMSILV
jgi:uncharacterized membrane protein